MIIGDESVTLVRNGLGLGDEIFAFVLGMVGDGRNFGGGNGFSFWRKVAAE